MDAAPRRNIELKARVTNIDDAARMALSLGATDHGNLAQRDTFFAVRRGRLKLRETCGEPAQLIWYERPNEPGARLSRYFLIEVDDAAALTTVLGAILGAVGVVEKKRRWLQLDNVRIHLDEIAGLGAFIEFEAVLAADQSESEGYRRVEELALRFGIHDGDRIDRSYAALLGLE